MEKTRKKNVKIDKKLKSEIYSDIKSCILELEESGKFQKSIKLTEKFKSELLKTNGANEEYIFCLEKLAQLYKDTCQYDKSEQILIELNNLNKNKLEKEPRDYANGLKGLAILYTKIGRYEDAEELLNESKSIYLSLPNLNRINLKSRECIENLNNKDKEDVAEYAIILNKLGKVYQEKGNNKNYLGETEKAQKYYDKAEESYTWAKRILRRSIGDMDIRYGRNLKDLANLYGILGKYGHAEEIMCEAHKIYKKTYSKDDPANFEIRNKLAWLKYKQCKYEDAALMFEYTKNKFGKFFKEHPDFARLLNNLAKTEVAYSYKCEDNPEYDVESRDALMGKAYDLMIEAFKVNNKIIPQLIYMDSDEQRLRFLRSLDYNMHLFLTLIMEYYYDITIPKARKDAFDFVLQRKSLTMEVNHFLKESNLLKKTDENYVTWNYISSQISHLNITKSTIGNDYNNSIEELKNKKDDIEIRNIPEKELENKLKSADRVTISNLMKANSVLIEYVKVYPYDFKSKGEKFSWKKPHYVAFLMHSGKPDDIKMMNLGKAEDIETQIMMFREVLNDYRNDLKEKKFVNKEVESKINKISSKLREMIFDPLKSRFKGIEHLIISPDDEISLIPLEILPIKSGYLIDKYKISYLGSSRDLLRFNEKRNPSSSPVVITNPYYFLDKPPTKKTSKKSQDDIISEQPKLPIFEIGPFTSLKNNQIEGEIVSEILRENDYDVNLIDKENATESLVKTLNSPFLMHIATHGYFINDEKDKNEKEDLKSTNKSDPLLKSGLALAGANSYLFFNEHPDYPEDGILTAGDVNSLNLSGTEMVVLSACETGLGKIERGEGVFGLRRSFILAGAKTLVMSLWAVNDLASRIMMEKFYQNLLFKDMERLSALRGSQEYLRNITIEELKVKFPKYADSISEYFGHVNDDFQPFSNPYFWGAFILQGDPSSLN